MAPKSSSKPKGESKQGLVVTLVFFILATIGLGISTYTGYTADDGKDKKLSDMKKEMDTAKADRDWFKYQRLQLLSYMGLLKAEEQADLVVKKGEFDNNKLGPDTEREAFRLLIKQSLEPRFKWDPAQNKPDKTYEALLVEERNKYDALEGQVKGLTKEKNDALQAKKAAEDQQAAAKKNFEDAVDKLAKKLEKDNDDLLKVKQELLAQNDRVAQQRDAVAKKGEEELKILRNTVDKQKKDLRDMRAQLDARDLVLEQIQQKGRDAPKDWRTDWQIVSIDTRGDTVYINLGSADRVTEQLTFSVHGLGTDHKPLPAAKGSMEVISVVGPHLSQARITGTKDRFRDPIIRGDILFNPSWNPTLRKHVAIAGLIDLTGEGRASVAEYSRNLDEFIRKLELQNVVVDAWLDPKDLSVKGKGLSVQTDYLILGDGQEYLADRGPGADLLKNITPKNMAMQDDAKKNGVQVIPIRKYLETIGYRLPKPVSEGAPYRPSSSDVPMKPKEPKPVEEPKKPMEPMEKPPKIDDKGGM